MKNVVLIGFMGTGKSTIGRLLANRLNRRFVDTDKEIERITGKTTARLISSHGMVRFRSEEALLVKKLVKEKGLVIATGGGTLLNEENYQLLGENGIFIGLSASHEVIYNRVKRKKKDRPLLDKGNLDEQITKLLEERREIYQKVALTVDTGLSSPDETVEEIVRFLNFSNGE
jgi:shikimate kinase